MHKLIEYVCDELEALEKKAEKGRLSSTEIQYADTLAHLKKNLLKAEEMEEADGYSSRYMDGGRSYAVRRDRMGRYSRTGDYSRSDGHDMIDRLRDMAHDAPDEQMRHEIEKLIRKMESM